ncbi:hypothetical protein SAMN05216337_1002348 [Bradyrhizobium brasilense]|uniref:Zinc ribbon domain-containing protein n=1 Tax=Bradyrhizobium brasilense TaxID=1419277 RepID=A0A1G6L6T7_9BRAD|nr:hypothetical protein SAMN05216337_1002348 [Bradyrhizobium brasilense]
MGMIQRRQELIGCHDCGEEVSFSAAACPHCGSREPSGPYIQSLREQRRHRIEERNDQTLMGMLVLCTGIGFFFGSVTGGAWAAFGYGLVGAIIGVPAGFIINVSRRLFG